MSDFYYPHEIRKATRVHTCTYCGQWIESGIRYVRQTGVYGNTWYVSKMHDECFDEMCASGDGEYMPYSQERPESGEYI